MRRRIRKLAKLVYDQVKRQSWRTIDTPGYYGGGGKIDSPEVMVNGREYDLQMKRDGWSLHVTVRVGGKVVYPGGKYHVFWRWAWEKKVFRRVLQNSYGIDITPCRTVMEDDIAALTPPKPERGSGRLSLED
jgi:hypothetical protein